MQAGGGRPDGTVKTWRWLETSSGVAQRQCEDVLSRRLFAAAPFPYPLPLPPSPTLSHPPFTGTVLCYLAVRRCWAARASRRRRCGASAGRSGRTGPWECGIDTRCADSPAFIQSTDTVEPNPGRRRDL